MQKKILILVLLMTVFFGLVVYVLFFQEGDAEVSSPSPAPSAGNTQAGATNTTGSTTTSAPTGAKPPTPATGRPGEKPLSNKYYVYPISETTPARKAPDPLPLLEVLVLDPFSGQEPKANTTPPKTDNSVPVPPVNLSALNGFILSGMQGGERPTVIFNNLEPLEVGQELAGTGFEVAEINHEDEVVILRDRATGQEVTKTFVKLGLR